MEAQTASAPVDLFAALLELGEVGRQAGTDRFGIRSHLGNHDALAFGRITLALGGTERDVEIVTQLADALQSLRDVRQFGDFWKPLYSHRRIMPTGRRRCH